MTDTKHENHSPDTLTRRDFLREAAMLGAAGVALGTVGCSQFAEAGYEPVPKSSLPAGKSKVILIRDESAINAEGAPQEGKVEEMLEKAISELTGESKSEKAWAKFFKPEDVVGVKINMMMTPTHPELSRSVVRGIMKADVPEKNIILWDRDSAGSGLAGATVRDQSFGYDSKSLSRIVTEKATALVNVPGMKAHWLAGVAVSLKNWVGALTNINVADIGASYKFHADSCAECCSIAAIPAIRDKSRLVVVDALRPLFDKGPQVNPRYLWPYRGIIVGVDPVAVDTVCMKILEAKRRQYKGEDWPLSPPPKHLLVAEQKYRLGHASMENIELVKLGWQEEILV